MKQKKTYIETIKERKLNYFKQIKTILEQSPKFKIACQEFKKNWLEDREIKPGGLPVDIAMKVAFAKIRKEFGLGAEWNNSIVGYALNGKVYPPEERFSIELDIFAKRIILEIGPNTTKDDIYVYWPVIEEYKKGLFGKQLLIIQIPLYKSEIICQK